MTFALFLLLCAVKSENKQEGPSTVVPQEIAPHIVQSLPHDADAFTQGLCYQNGLLYESTGLYQASRIRSLDTRGAILIDKPLSSDIFAEGCTVFKGKLYQITWKKQVCFVYNLPDLICRDTLFYSGEGWGLTSNGLHFIMSNGTDTLYFRDDAFSITHTLPVTWNGNPLKNINELEYGHGHIYANVWYNDFIFEINPATGIVKRVINCSELVLQENPATTEHVLNGIAYNTEKNLFYLTGKKWATLFVVTLPDNGDN